MKITGETKIVGVIGYPIAHSLSPILHNAAFKEVELNFAYLPFLVRPRDLGKAIKAMRALNIVGMNITVPFKEKVMSYLDELSPEAKIIGAVNTVYNKKGKLIGYNTDAEGFIKSLTTEGEFNPQGKNVLLMGAGGAAYAISFALVNAGVKKLTITNRTARKTKALLAHLEKTFKDKCELSFLDFSRRNSSKIMSKVDLFINATSVGMSPEDPLLINPDLFAKTTFVYDVVYNRETKLLRAARKRGLSGMGGAGMLIHQGALSFEIWTHQRAPIRTMRRALEEICCAI
ncbi:shikimate dehydrogenase [Candidatus Aerophobetes bacterium]|uniref:Shikimate dehydrogenase (NADP(+)) n=1 Tax=Aerophobetes bacterium TaxID=2030807 RepID=A0A662D417_UNCAE|nr:MAG: shikimate dehydrogenase [Candidatus Aerophobetes bacterium]